MRLNELVNHSKFTHLQKGKQRLNSWDQGWGPQVPPFGSCLVLLITSEVGNYTLGLQQLVLQNFLAPGHHCVSAAAPALSGAGLAGREEHLS